eukprot:m51a1_g9401 hypothetical protein (404) ;mRNA; f:293806-295410
MAVETRSRTVRAGDPVLLQKARVARTAYDVSTLVGAAYGSVYAAERGGALALALPEAPSVSAGAAAESSQDNRKLVDDNTAQRLGKDQIEELRKGGADGTAIVSALVENSASFKDKTAFAQEKYIKKKLKKHVAQIKLLEPTAFNIATAAYAENPAKVGFVRPDMLAKMLYMLAVRAGTRALVCENCSGVLLGSIAERVSSQGNGAVVNVHTGSKPEGGGYLKHFISSRLSPIVNVPMARVLAPDFNAGAEVGQCDSLAIAVRFRPIDVVRALLPLVKPSGCVAVFCAYLQPLLDVAEDLTMRGAAAHVELCESFWREHQVLPDRTHPLVDMNGHPGYMLTAIRLAPRPQAEAAPQEAQQQEEEMPDAPAEAEEAAAQPAAKRQKAEEEEGKDGDDAPAPMDS